MLESENTKDKLASAGYRGQAPLIASCSFRFVMPFVGFAGTLFYLFVMTHFAWSDLQKLLAACAGAFIGFYLPDLFVNNKISRRQQSIMRAFPDALDLMLICVESGMSIESSFSKVADEIGTQSSELAEELALTTAELSYLPDRRQAFDNLAKRCGHSGVKAVATALNQAEKYGTPMGQALRVTANENREMRMQDAERRAASLPAKLTVPMIVFFLPCLFVVILGPRDHADRPYDPLERNCGFAPVHLFVARSCGVGGIGVPAGSQFPHRARAAHSGTLKAGGSPASRSRPTGRRSRRPWRSSPWRDRDGRPRRGQGRCAGWRRGEWNGSRQTLFRG